MQVFFKDLQIKILVNNRAANHIILFTFYLIYVNLKYIVNNNNGGKV